MKVLILEQNTPEWLAWREANALKMGFASEAAAVMGAGKFRRRNRCELWLAKKGLLPRPGGSAIAHGHNMEPIARKWLELYLGEAFKPVVGESHDSASRHPADGIIDALLLTIGPHPVAFDLDPGPFGQLRVRDAVFRHGYDDFRLGQFCDGWIYRKPISTFEGVTPVAHWINEDNLDRARLQSPNPAYRQASAKEFNSAIARSADIPARWGFLR